MTTERENESFRLQFADQITAVQSLWFIDVILTILAVCGLLLNLVLLFVVCRRKKPWAVDVMLISIVAIFDILWCCTLLISLISRWILGDSVLVSESTWCQFSSIFFNASYISGFVCTAILALARYLAIVCKLHLSNKIWIGISLSLVIFLWILFIQRGITEIRFVLPAGFYCFPQVFGEDWATKFFEYFLSALMYPSLIIIPACYILVTLYYRRQMTKLYSFKNESLLEKLNRGTLHLLFILLAYSIAVFPDVIHVFLSLYLRIKRTPLSDGIVMSLEFCVSSINAIFALLMHDEIKVEFHKFTGIPHKRRSFM